MSQRANLDYPSPFSRQPQRWASPPAPEGPGGQPVTTVGLSSITFATRQTGVVGTAFPSLTRVAAIGFSQPIIVLAVTLSSSITNSSTTDVAAVVVHKDIGSVIGVASGYDFFAEHLVEKALSHSIRTGTAYVDNIAPSFGTNERMAIYMVLTDINCAATAIASIRFLTVS